MTTTTSSTLPFSGFGGFGPGRIGAQRDGVLRCRDRLARRVAERVGPDGLVSAPCESRVLESALLLALLTAEQAASEARDRLVRFLKTTLDIRPPDAIQVALGRAALGDGVPGDSFVVRALAPFEHFTAARKRLMFQTLLAELGAADFPCASLDAFRADGQQSWLQLEMRALKVMAAFGTGDPGAVTEQDWAALAPAVRPGPLWEGNHLARLLGLLALRKHPAHRPAVLRALTGVVAALRPDGGLPFITGMDVFATAIAGSALAGTTHPAPLLAVMSDGLAARQNPDGGFGFTVGVAQSDVDDASYGIEFLRAVAPDRHRRTITAAERYLLAQRNPDGGFPTFARGTQSEIAITAAAVNALAPNPAHRAAADQGLAFITGRDGRSAQGGGILERSWSRNFSNAVFRVTLACDTVHPGTEPELRRAAVAVKQGAAEYLAGVQNGDGGWGHQPGDPSDPISTAYAVIALSRSRAHAPARHRALDHLVRCEQYGGGYVSRPDQAGPRPLLYDVPALADVCVLLALAHAVGPGRPGGW
ncbi:terpene cyclase/mutase family protein [Kitasatospora sp. MAP5-34]|uniref:prenyltransferase/squalene oxidase repeat-containing protein n=1 Tax=Kitasatospora sp. MAP5-34 TaxID=3035102 RepID=UPI002474572E|nr:terpene cyclase/mutase family protein [Kitasatospora sp. MAP5-34]MDH6575410.1 squalene-hopene/tetraprenyl-beta-curcumene cyclase [Kitasatospora sp. MAP5-34]